MTPLTGTSEQFEDLLIGKGFVVPLAGKTQLVRHG